MQGFELVSSFLLNRKFRASKSPTFHILTVVGNALTTRQKNEAIIQAIKNNYI